MMKVRKRDDEVEQFCKEGNINAQGHPENDSDEALHFAL